MVAICPNLYATGVCTDTSCTKRHDVKICRDCGVVCSSDHVYSSHINGRRHRTTVRGLNVTYHCAVCRINLIGGVVWSQHIAGRRHRSNADQQGVSPDVEPEEAPLVEGQMYCSVCSQSVPEHLWTRHPTSRVHQRKARFAKFEAAFEEAAKDKHGVTVSHHPDGLDFGIVEIANAQTSVSLTLSVKSTVPRSSITLVEAKFPASRIARTSPFLITLNGPQNLVYGRDLVVPVTFRHSLRGLYATRIELIFQDNTLNQRFVIVRSAKAIVGDQAEYDRLQPVAPYVPKKRMTREQEREVIPGDPPPAIGTIKYVTHLPEAPIPERVSSALSRGSTASIIQHFQRSLLPPSLGSTTYGRHFKNLLWAEEYRSEVDLQIYDIESANLTRHNTYFYLGVPGLAEKRPSVLVGDRILVQPHGSDTGRWFEGCVHVVHKDEVGMKFHLTFNSFYSGEKQRFKVRFKLNRYPLRRQHQALDTAFYPERLLFPTGEHATRINAPPVIQMLAAVHNRLIAGNPPQLQAVTSIAHAAPGSPPFVIFGPPGTGKTVTVVEAIRQVLVRNPNAHILACAPSNSAADLIASRLTMLGTEELFRFYAPSRFKSQVPDELLRYTCTTLSGHFSAPPVPTLRRFKVTVATCVSASFAYGVGMPRGHFTHIFVDEAGQATEPEVMIAVKTMADNSTNVILSGDPKQLGPIIRSAVARDLGLEKSYLERMMEREAYDEINSRGINVVKLVQNFRSHPTILRFPNEKFYRSELEPHGDPRMINAYINSPHLVNKKFPIIFHALSGKDDREASSPSFFNVLEALQVRDYVKALRDDRQVRIADADIGVIAPYHAQCLRIRATLKAVADGVKVGSVEEFQGQERRVIIISTVRSSREFVEYDLKHTLGFVANPRRMNVAVTRAQALLIIVGDPLVLSLDPLWREFLNYIYNNGGWKGDAPGWDTSAPVREAGGYDQEIRDAGVEDMNDFARRMESLTLQGATGEEDEDEDNHDRPWREVE